MIELIGEMSSLSLVAGNCGRGNGTDDQSFEFGWSSYFGKHLFTSHFRKNSFRRLNEHWSKSLEGSRIGNGNRFYVAAKIKKGKKHDYPWPDDIDPNISSGYLTYLSHFKPLDEKPKPVTLPFEKPLVDLEKKIIEVSFSCFIGIWCCTFAIRGTTREQSLSFKS